MCVQCCKSTKAKKFNFISQAQTRMFFASPPPSWSHMKVSLCQKTTPPCLSLCLISPRVEKLLYAGSREFLVLKCVKNWTVAAELFTLLLSPPFYRQICGGGGIIFKSRDIGSL